MDGSDRRKETSANYQGIFERKEIKFFLTDGQYDAMRQKIGTFTVPDAYPFSRISNIYYDTDTCRLLRTSLDKPLYKEKLRLRVYGEVSDTSPAFVEMKKKLDGVTYKRRLMLPYAEAYEWLAGERPEPEGQIAREFSYMMHLYGRLQPRFAVFYERESLRGTQDPCLRITFDSNIRYRTKKTDLRYGDGGNPILGRGQHLMEIKTSAGLPLPLVSALSEYGIRSVSFSKCGSAYQIEFRERNIKGDCHHV